MNMGEMPAGFAPGVHYALPFADYLAIDALSASGMKRLLQSPLHYQADRLVARKPSAAMNFGIAAHLLTLEPDRFALEDAAATDGVVTLDLAPVPGQYVLSDLTSGPVLFATC